MELTQTLDALPSPVHGETEGVVDELIVYLAPQLLGDAARGMFDLGELTALDRRIELTISDVRRIDADLRVIARLTRFD